jgi:signal transduction histidine kinase
MVVTPGLSLLCGLAGVVLVLFATGTILSLATRDPLHRAFALTSLGAFLYVSCNVELYGTADRAAYLSVLQVQMYGTALFFIGFLWHSLVRLERPWRRPILLFTILFGIEIVARHVDPMLTYARFTGMQPFWLLWGERVWIPDAVAGIWGHVYTGLVFSVCGVVLWEALRVARSGKKRDAAGVAAGAGVLLVAMSHDALVFVLGLRWVFLVELSLVGLLILLAYEVVRALLRVRELAAKVQALNEDLERRVALRTEQLEAANRGLEAFSYSVSHDLRAPLRAVAGYARVLEEDHAAELGDEARSMLTRILAASDRMGRLISNVLELSRLGREALSIRPVDMAEVVREARETLASDLAGRRVDWVVGDLPVTTGDPVLLRLVMQNLLDNAVKYTSKTDDARIEVGSERRDGRDIFFVRDNGVGFDAAQAAQLFDAFHRLPGAGAYPGLGIGLATVKRIVELHGGSVWAEGSPGMGATFSFGLPSAPAFARPTQPQGQGVA